MIFLNFPRHTHFHDDIETRQFEMLRTYAFKCYCEACENRYKMFSAAPEFADTDFEQKFTKAELGLLMNFLNLDFTWKFYDRACKYMQKHGTKNYSVRETYIMYFSMLRCLTVAMDFQTDLKSS